MPPRRTLAALVLAVLVSGVAGCSTGGTHPVSRAGSATAAVSAAAVSAAAGTSAASSAPTGRPTTGSASPAAPRSTASPAADAGAHGSPSATSATPTPATPTATTAAGPAGTWTSPAAPVRLQQTTRETHVARTTVTWPVVDAVAGVAPAASAAIAAELNRVVVGLTRPGSSDVARHLDLRVTEADRTYVTVLLLTEVDSGGAHPNTAVGAFTFDRATGARLSLTDWVRPGRLSATLAALSARTRGLLPAVLGPAYERSWVEDGTAPTITDFGVLVPRPEGLEVVFQQYQVAAYALGMPAVVVPWPALGGLSARPLPVADAPLPAYRLGQPDQPMFGLADAVVAAVRAGGGRYGLPAGGYRVEDVRYAPYADATQATLYAAAHVVPVADPGADRTALLVGTYGGASAPSFRLVAAGHGAVCAAPGFTAAAFAALGMGC